jgi:hypothetical protein
VKIRILITLSWLIYIGLLVRTLIASGTTTFMPFYTLSSLFGLIAVISSVRNSSYHLKYAAFAAGIYCSVQIAWYVYWSVKLGTAFESDWLWGFRYLAESILKLWSHRAETFGVLNAFEGIYTNILMLIIQAVIIFFSSKKIHSRKKEITTYATTP